MEFSDKRKKELFTLILGKAPSDCFDPFENPQDCKELCLAANVICRYQNVSTEMVFVQPIGFDAAVVAAVLDRSKPFAGVLPVLTKSCLEKYENGIAWATLKKMSMPELFSMWDRIAQRACPPEMWKERISLCFDSLLQKITN